jgi:competence protein ComEC
MAALSRRPLAWGGLFCLAGVALPERAREPVAPAAAGIVAFVGLARFAPGAAPAALLAGAILLGHTARVARSEAPTFEDREAIRGTVLRTAGDRVLVEFAEGRVTFAWPDDSVPAPGDAIAALLRPPFPMETLPGDPSPLFFDDDLGRATSRAAMAATILRRPSADDPDAWLEGASHRGLLRAFVTGDRREVTDAETALLRATGTTHLLSVSGLHVGMVALFVAGIVWVPSRLLGLWSGPWMRAVPGFVAAIGSVTFALFVGNPAPAARAAWMASAGAVLRARGRRVDAWNLLGLAVLVTCCSDPGVTGTLSFQLSYAAMAGMLAVGPTIARLLPPDVPAIARWFVASVATSIGATLGTLPWSALLFQSLAPLGFVANLVAVPISGCAVPLALVARFAPAPLAGVALRCADALTGALLLWLEAVRGPLWHPAVPFAGAFALGTIPFVVRRPGLVLAAICAACMRVFPANVLTVTFLAVGQGDAALVEWPDGRVWVVDGGPSSDQLLRYLRRRSLLRVDVAVLSHPHPDHLGGLLPILESLEVGELWVPRPPRVDELDYRAAWRVAFDRGIAIRTPRDLEDRIEHPLFGWTSPARAVSSQVNDESLVLRIQHGAQSFLFTGDVESAAERWLAPFLLPATVAKVPHHGSRSSSSPAFVEALGAEWAVVSCGRDNRFHHPAPDTLNRWSRTRVARTDRDGSIRFVSDGTTLFVEAEGEQGRTDITGRPRAVRESIR